MSTLERDVPDAEIERLLGELAETATPSTEAEPGQARADLDRGRRAVRRRRSGVVTAMALAAAVVVGGTVVTTQVLGDDPGGTHEPGLTQRPTARDGAPTPSPADLGPRRLLDQYRDVLERHLDPAGDHLDARVTNTQTADGIGTKLGWSVAGSEGLGMVQVFVGRSFGGGVGWPCATDPSWQCRREQVAGVDATVGTRADDLAVGVVRSDGSRASITTSALFGNNATEAVRGVAVTPAQLVAALVDPALAAPTSEQLRTVARRFRLQIQHWSGG